MSNELRECPFCGGEAHLGSYEAEPTVPIFYWVECMQCRADTPLQGVHSKEDAIAAWNRRGQQYILVMDDGAHWLVVPADKEDEWDAYCDAVFEYWSNVIDGDPPVKPEWVVTVGGAQSLVKFTSYTIDSEQSS